MIGEKWGAEGEDENGHPILPVIKVMISGINGELLQLIVESDTYAKRPFVLIKNVDKLLAVPDAEFQKYSPEDRSNLVARFSAANYAQTNSPLETNAPSAKP